ncbi:Pyridoxine/pyridoxamine 5'-phosphate oxidase 1, chloroplastic [Asimina triloba]
MDGHWHRIRRTMSCLITGSVFTPSSFTPTNSILPPSHSRFLPPLPSGFLGRCRRLLTLLPSSAFGTKSGGEFTGMAGRPVSSLENLQNPENISYLSQREAAEIDEILMGPLGFSVDQLMELAGLSVAASIAEVYKSSSYGRILAICGPGNNGGDGLVAARHLHHFGYKPFVCYPKRTPKALYSGLVTQLESLSIPFLSEEELPLDLSDDFDIIIDAIFGFSFHGKPRPPFDNLLQRLVGLHHLDQTHQRSPAIVSVDIPSGWHVEEGDIDGNGIKPNMLVSLTAPKLCAKKFHGPHHFLGGRFVPPSIVEKYKLHLPPYPGTSMCVRIGKPPSVDISALRENYVSPEFVEDQVDADPINQFNKWFDDAVAAGLPEPNAMALSTANKDGRPYTNYESRKAHELSENPYAALVFFWDCLHRSVRVEGTVQKVSEEESENYFHSRPRGSQIGAIVSKQSTVVPNRDVLHKEYNELEAKFSESSLIPKPKCWGGYRLKPSSVEFWQGQPSRLHDRLQYSLRDVNGKNTWRIVRAEHKELKMALPSQQAAAHGTENNTAIALEDAIVIFFIVIFVCALSQLIGVTVKHFLHFIP